MSHTYAALYYHIVFSTRYREPLITDEVRDRLYSYIGGIVRREEGQLIAAGGVEDHPHLLLWTPTSIAIADLVRTVKSRSSRWVAETFPSLGAFALQSGYSAFTVGYGNLPAVKRYIAGQVMHHQRFSFMEEISMLHQLHGLPFEADNVDQKDRLKGPSGHAGR